MTSRSPVASSTGSSVGPTASTSGLPALRRGRAEAVACAAAAFDSAESRTYTLPSPAIASAQDRSRPRRGDPGRGSRRPAGSRDQRDIARGVVRPPRVGGVVRRADRDENGAHALVPEIELHLLEWALDEKRCIGVDDRSNTLERQPAGDAHQQLLPDADVDDPVAGAACASRERSDADVGEDDDDARVVLECVGRRPRRTARAWSCSLRLDLRDDRVSAGRWRRQATRRTSAS